MKRKNKKSFTLHYRPQSSLLFPEVAPAPDHVPNDESFVCISWFITALHLPRSASMWFLFAQHLPNPLFSCSSMPCLSPFFHPGSFLLSLSLSLSGPALASFFGYCGSSVHAVTSFLSSKSCPSMCCALWPGREQSPNSIESKGGRRRGRACGEWERAEIVRIGVGRRAETVGSWKSGCWGEGRLQEEEMEGQKAKGVAAWISPQPLDTSPATAYSAVTVGGEEYKTILQN